MKFYSVYINPSNLVKPKSQRPADFSGKMSVLKNQRTQWKTQHLKVSMDGREKFLESKALAEIGQVLVRPLLVMVHFCRIII